MAGDMTWEVLRFGLIESELPRVDLPRLLQALRALAA